MEDTLEKYYASFTEKSLKELHEGATRAYDNDRNLTPQQKDSARYFGSPFAYYGTDEEKDWPEHVEAIENVMKEKGISFTRIIR
ncbi:TPA: hypothetical protein SMF39_001120 [Serratia marcescens]|uniref:hypothetical protein n=1 Tax=Serratia TaxID=613 RepID=UPI0018DA2F28|nr:hypothetical protein [Serratia sp. PL17]EIY4262222.1 hypothetical protein [Serratia marcescens]MBH2628892.1 hypothetical protein [Serratia marcescens]MBH2642740.1 hypothetical protein [Serratia marcescens]MBN5448137.1 hypothetical protein [Serratia marcescens]MBP1129264.1 Fic family protein [Serratia sp. PL17]